MEGNIITIDYAETNNFSQKNQFKSYFGSFKGLQELPKDGMIVKKMGYIMTLEEELQVLKGSGTAGGGGRGGGWRPSPNKPDDNRYLGKPGEKVRTTDRDSQGNVKYWKETKIGSNGKAVKERHYTDHKKPWVHSNPHDHIIDWSEGCPNQDKYPAINYFDGNVPEFKRFELENYMMKNETEYRLGTPNTIEQNKFVSIDDFKDCMKRGGEVEFEWNNKDYSITHRNQHTISVSEWYKQETEKLFSTVDELLDHKLEGEPLRKIVMKLKVWDRTI